MRIALTVTVACLMFGGLAAAGDATAAIRRETHIPAEGLAPALTEIAKEFEFQVLYRTEIVSDVRSPGAIGALTSDEALGRVLTGTGLTYRYLDDKTVTIVPLSRGDWEKATVQSASGSSDEAITSKEVGKKSSQSFRLAQLDKRQAAKPSSIDGQNSHSAGPSEIFVTAQSGRVVLRRG